MRLWIRYLQEKKLTLTLYFLTAGLFLAVGSLYHIENLGKLCYAAVLTLAVWTGAGVLDGIKYVRRSRQLEAVFRHYEQSGEMILGEAEKGLKSLADSMEAAESYGDAQAYFLRAMYERQRKERLHREERLAESGDYYLMWTHQIKTPIAALKLLLERLELSDRNGFLMKEECFKIEQYVEMVLAFQRLESISDDMVVQRCRLDSLVRQAVKNHRQQPGHWLRLQRRADLRDHLQLQLCGAVQGLGRGQRPQGRGRGAGQERVRLAHHVLCLLRRPRLENHRGERPAGPGPGGAVTSKFINP